MLRYTLRSLLRTRNFTVAALLCLALGIGATTTIFSIVNAVVLQPLPYPNSGKLVRIYTEFPQFPGGGLHKFWVSEPELFDLQKAKSFSVIGAWGTTGVNLAGSTEPVRVTAAYLTEGAMRALRVKPLLGRLFTAEEDKPGAPTVALISYGTWQRVFGGDPNIVNREVYLNSAKCTVIGVMAKSFAFPPGEIDPPQMWTPLQPNPNSTSRGSHDYSVFGRLKDGVTLAQARNEMASLVAAWGEAKSPNNHVFNPESHPISMYSFYDEVVGTARRPVLLLLGAVVFVLLIACVNVANLLLARSEGRQREIAIRRAVGAANSHLVKQFLVEGAVLSLGGGVLGILLAVINLELIKSTNPGSIPRADEIQISWLVLLFTLGISLLSGMLFGLAPMVTMSAIRVYETLKSNSGRASSSVASNRYRKVLVMSEMAMAFVLLAGAGAMIRGFVKLQNVNGGFNPQGLLTMQLSLPDANYKSDAAQANFWTRLQERLDHLPGITSVTLASGLPPVRQINRNDTQIEGFVPVPNGPTQNVAYYQSVGDRFFETFGARMIEGRALDARDGDLKTPGVVINKTMARTFWPHESSVLGRRIKPFSPSMSWFTVVGVVADIKNGGLDQPTDTELFLPSRLSPRQNLYVIAKTSGDPRQFTNTIRSAINEIDPSLPVANVRTMDEVLSSANARPRFLTLILTLFSVLALGLALVGIYGVISYSVAQRTSEFGIKMALGANPQTLLWQVLRQGLVLGIAGGAVGFLGALVLMQSLEGLIFGVQSLDAVSLASTAILLMLATAVACCFPALRAVRIDPATALRYE